MSEKPTWDEPKQKTRKGHEILIPKRDEFFGNLGKVAKTNDSETKSRPKKSYSWLWESFILAVGERLADEPSAFLPFVLFPFYVLFVRTAFTCLGHFHVQRSYSSLR